MLHTSTFLSHLKFEQAISILPHFLIPISKHTLSAFSSIQSLQQPLPSTPNQTHNHPSSLNFSRFIKFIQSKTAHIENANKGESFTNHSLKDCIFRLSNVSPETIRRFWRVDALNPHDVLEILLGFESCNGKYEVEVEKIESLWGIFRWASEQSGEFEHLPQSCKIMASMLVRVGLCREAEYVLSKRESRGVLLDCEEVFSNLIERYVEEFELDRGVSVYERMRGLSLVPSVSCYEALVKYLVELDETRLVYHVYMDMLETGSGESLEDRSIHEKVIRLLCVDGKVREARDIFRKVREFGVEPSSVVVNAIISGYCEKKDYEDILGFFAEVKTAPDVIVGNKILFSLCRSFGVEEASMFMQKLEELGFCPDEATFGILIGSSCCEGNLKDAFIYVSDCLSRGLKPHVYSYNALLSGILKEGLWKNSRDLLAEMYDMGVTPNLSTFKVLLAGFCRARKFDEVNGVIDQMANQGLVELTYTEDPVSQAFMFLGLDPSSVKIKRDNNKGFPKSEFFDSLGNGFYLDTNLDEYEKWVVDVLDEAMIPDFTYLILGNCQNRDSQGTLALIDDMEKWGQEIPFPAFSSLFIQFSKAPLRIKIINRLLEVTFESVYQLDHKSLNMLAQIYSKRGLTFKARSLVEGMVRRGQIIENSVLSALMFDICKRGDSRSLRYICRLAHKFGWSPEGEAGNRVLGYLCQTKWLKEAFELLETMMFDDNCNRLDIFCLFLGELCSHGFTSTAHALVEESSNEGFVVDHMAYSHLFRGFCQEKKFRDAMKISDILQSKNLAPPPDVSIQLIPQLCRINEFEKAVALKDACLKEQPSELLPLHCALIKGLSMFGRVEEAASLLKDMRPVSLDPDVEVFNALIQGYCRARNLTKVEQLLGFVIRKNLSISSPSYSDTVGLLCTEGKLSLALRFKELALQVSELPELVLYNILIFNLLKKQNIFLVDKVIDALQKKGLQFDEATYNFTIQGFLLCKDISRPLQYLSTMMKQDLKPNNRSLRKTISCLCLHGKLDKALALSREMESRGWVHGSVIQNSIIDCLLKKGEIQEAVVFLDRMELKSLTPDNIQYDYLIKQFYKHGRLDIAVHLLNAMLKKGGVPDSTSYGYVIQGFCINCRDLDIALDWHAEMIFRGLKPSMVSWDVLVRGLCEEGRVAEAEKLLKSMIQLGESPSRDIFMCVIGKYRSQSNVGKASELLKVMQENGYEPDFETHWSVIRDLTGSNKKDDGNQKGSFLSRLLSDVGFTRNNPKSSVG